MIEKEIGQLEKEHGRLSKEDEYQLFIDKPDNICEILFYSNLAFICWMGKRYNQLPEESMTVGWEAVKSAVPKFKTEKNCRFHTYLSFFLRKGFRNELSIDRKTPEFVSLEQEVSDNLSLEDLIDSNHDKDENLSEFFEAVWDVIETVANDTEIKYIKDYMNGSTYAEIGKKYGLNGRNEVYPQLKRVFNRVKQVIERGHSW